MERLKKAGVNVRPMSSLLSEPLMNGVFKKPANAGRGVKLVNVFDLYGDTAVDLNQVGQLDVSPAELKRFAVEKGDLFFTRSSLKPEGVAWSAYLEECEQQAVFECHLIRARLDESECEPGFVSNYARTWLAREYLVARAGVTTMATVDQGTIENLPVVLPALAVQKSLLAELNAARQTRARQLADADALLAGLDAVLLDALGLALPADSKTVFAIRARDLVGPLNPERYRGMQLEKALPFQTAVGDAVDWIDTRVTPTSAAPDELWDWIRIDDLPNQPWQVESVRTETGANIGGTFFEVQENDILVARLGPTILNAKFVLCPKLARRTVASTEFLVLRCRAEWQSNAVLWLLRTKLYRDIMYARSRGATPSRFRLDGADLLSISFPQMAPELQTQIAEEVRQRQSEARRLRAEAERGWDAAKAWFETQLLGEARP